MAYSTIIPSRNVDNLKACIGALRAAGETARVIVVWDPAGGLSCILPEGTVEVISGLSPFCFAQNINLGIRAAGPDDVVLLNDDALLERPSGFVEMERISHENQNVGVLAAATNVTGYPAQRMQLRCPCECRCVRFAAFVAVYIRREVLDTIGLLDERFVGCYGGEDVDYCLRVREAGMDVAVTDRVFVDHAHLPSTFRAAHPRNEAPGDISESNRIGREKWGNKWPRL